MPSHTKAYIPDKIFTGEEWRSAYSILVEDGIISDLVPLSALDNSTEKEEFPGCFIAPAFIDIQIYGANNKLFAAFPEPDALQDLVSYCNQGGAAYCVPTFATNNMEVFYKGIDAIRKYWSNNGKGVLGLHLEGPWINPVKKGAHVESLINLPAIEEVRSLLDYGKGVIKMITLAPEICSREIIDLILSYGIVISAGHSNASYEEAMNGFDLGISTVTHLYNAMSPLQHRQPGLTGAAFDHPSVMASIIPDGYHVDWPAVRIAKKIMKERLFAITDAVTETSKGYYMHEPAGDKFEVAGILSGSALTMAGALKNLITHAGIPINEALRMCSSLPAKALRIDDQLGWLKNGYRASMVMLDKDLRVRKLICD